MAQHPHPFGPFTNPYVPARPTAPVAQPAPAPMPAPVPLGRGAPNGAWALNQNHGHVFPVTPARAPVQPAIFGPAPGAAPLPTQPAQQPAPRADGRHVHFASETQKSPYHPHAPLTPEEQRKFLPQTLFRSPQSSNGSLGPSPASMTRPLPVQTPPRIVFGTNMPRGYPDPHPNFRLDSDHPIKWRDIAYTDGARLFHSQKFAYIPENQGVIELVRGSANPKLESERYRPYWRRDWERDQDRMMLDIVHHKMAQYEEIEAELLRTGYAELVNSDPDDRTNCLGRALMVHRESTLPRRR